MTAKIKNWAAGFVASVTIMAGITWFIQRTDTNRELAEAAVEASPEIREAFGDIRDLALTEARYVNKNSVPEAPAYRSYFYAVSGTKRNGFVIVRVEGETDQNLTVRIEAIEPAGGR